MATMMAADDEDNEVDGDGATGDGAMGDGATGDGATTMTMAMGGNTREGGEAGDGDVSGDFFRLRHCCESVLESGEVDLL